MEKIYFDKVSHVLNTIIRVENSNKKKRLKKASDINISPFFSTLIISLSSFILIELLQNRSVLIISSGTGPQDWFYQTRSFRHMQLFCALVISLGEGIFFPHNTLIISMSCMVLTRKILLNISQVNYFEDANTPFVNNPL